MTVTAETWRGCEFEYDDGRQAGWVKGFEASKLVSLARGPASGVSDSVRFIGHVNDSRADHWSGHLRAAGGQVERYKKLNGQLHSAALA